MSDAGATRTGLVLGAACVIPVIVWVAGVVGENPMQGLDRATLADALSGLLTAQGITIALAAPRGVGSTRIATLGGLLVVIATPLPLLTVAALGGAASGAGLAAGVALGTSWAVGLVVVGRAIERWISGCEPRRLLLGGAEVVLAVAVWVFREEWLSWVRL